MKKILSWLCMAAIFCSIGTASTLLQTSAALSEDVPITPVQYQKMLGKGMDVDWSKTGQGQKQYSETAVKKFKKAGISHVRIRVKNAASESLFQILDRQINDCIRNGLVPVLAYQANEFKNSVSDESMASAVGWWKTVAEHYKDYPYLLSFDLMIECSDALNKQQDRLNEYFEQAVSAIRVTNPNRILMMSPRVRSDAAYLQELEIPTRANGYMMAEWHFYASGPSKENARKLWTTGTKAEKKLINDKINLALNWQKETGIPTWVGAWMAGNYNDGDDYSMDEQVKFAHYMVSQLDKAGIPFAVNSDTKFYNRETNEWVTDMLPLRYCIFDSYEKALNKLFSQSTVKLFSAKAVSGSRVRISWEKLKRAAGYRLIVSASPKFNRWKKQYKLTNTSKTVLNLQRGKTYYMRARGYRNASGKIIYSHYSRTVKVRL